MLVKVIVRNTYDCRCDSAQCEQIVPILVLYSTDVAYHLESLCMGYGYRSSCWPFSMPRMRKQDSLLYNGYLCYDREWVGMVLQFLFFFFSSRRRHTRFDCDWSSDVCSSD